MLKYWDDLISVGLLLLDNFQDKAKINCIVNVLEDLMQCNNVVQVIKEVENLKLSGIYNMLVGLQKNKIEDVLGNGGNVGSGLRRFRLECRIKIFMEFVRYFVEELMNIKIKIKSQSQNIQTDNMEYNQRVQDILGNTISIIPLIQNELTLENRAKIINIRAKIIKYTNKTPIINKYRLIYHKITAILLQQYDNSSKTSSTIKYIYNYLRSYHHLYPLQSSTRTTHKCKNHRQSINNIRKSLSRIFEQKPSFYYNELLYIDFLQWMIETTDKKCHKQLTNLSQQILEQRIGTNKLDDYLQANIEQITNSIAQTYTYTYNDTDTDTDNDIYTKPNEDNNNKDKDIMQKYEIIGGCLNKLLYLQIHTKLSNANTNVNINTNTNTNNKTDIKLNLQFELQECSAHIAKLCVLIKDFAKLCHNIIKFIGLQFKQLNMQIVDVKDWICSAKKPQKLKYLTNYQRFIVCLNNGIGLSHRIGLNINIDQRILEKLIFTKLAICYSYESLPYFYLQYSQMIYLGYIKLTPKTLININNFIDINNQQNISHIITIIKIYTNQINIKSHLLNPEIIKQPLFKLILAVQNIHHMNPHKTLIKSITGHIFTQKSLDYESIIRYSSNLLPITSTISWKSTYNTDRYQAKYILQNNTNHIEHRILGSILERILLCFLMNQQLSEMRSILKLATVYFLRSVNLGGVLIVLRCHQLRINNGQYNSSSNNISTNRQSHLQPLTSQPQPTLNNWLGIKDMISITDSLTNILSSIYLTKFNIKSMNKFTRVILHNDHRKSVSFHIKLESILKELKESVIQCGKIGAEVFMILGDYARETLFLYEGGLVYKEYLQILQRSGELSMDNSSNSSELSQQHIQQLTQIEIYKYINTVIHKFLNKLTQQTTITNFQKISKLLKQILPYSYYHAKILQSLYTSILSINQENLNKLTNIIVQCVCGILDHNYRYKSYIQKTVPIDNKDIHIGVIEANIKYQKYCKEYLNIGYYSDKLISSSYPITIIYPLGSYLLTISICQIVIISMQSRVDLEEIIHTVDTLIANNSKLLNNKNVDPKHWWKSRDRVDRALGKIVNDTGIWGWDNKVRLGFLKDLGPSMKQLWKFMTICYKNRVGDLKKIKQLIQTTNIKIQTLPITLDELYLQIMLAESEQCSSSCKPLENMLLLVHPNYSCFPYESISLLAKTRAVYRLISPSYLIQKQQDMNHNSFNVNNTMFLVNSANDLLDTQKNFYKIKDGFPSWRGIVGKKPTVDQYLQLLQRDVFLYMGHGTGSSHLKFSQFYQHRIQSLMLLFGCSSVGMTQDKCQPSGYAHSHLINGCPSILGCLWEVTDKDTDRITETIFKNLKKRPQSLSQILNIAKNSCKHQYLNGGALVVFGVPSNVSSE